MKYLFELLKRKKYVAVIVCIIIALIGAAIVYFPASDIIINGVPKLDELIWGNIPFIIFGIAIIYWGLFYIPSVSAFIQNKEDYVIEYLEDGVQIKYKHYRFVLKKESAIKMWTFQGKDADGNVVSRKLSSQIYSGLVYYFPRFSTSVLPEDAEILEKSDNIEKFEIFGLKEATKEEVQAYIKCKKFLSKWLPLSCLTVATILYVVLLCLEHSTYHVSETVNIILACGIFPTAMVGIFSLFKITSDNTDRKRIEYGKVYIGDCYVYDREIAHSSSGSSSTTHYYVRVKTDKNDYIDSWIDVSLKLFDDCKDNKDKQYKLIVIKYKDRTEYDVRFPDEMETNESEVIKY